MERVIAYTVYNEGQDGPEFVCAECILRHPSIEHNNTLKVCVIEGDDLEVFCNTCSACYDSIAS